MRHPAHHAPSRTSRRTRVLCTLLLFNLGPASAFLHACEHTHASTFIQPPGQVLSDIFHESLLPGRTELDLPCTVPPITAFAAAFSTRTHRGGDWTNGQPRCCGPSIRSSAVSLGPGDVAFSRSRNLNAAGWVWDGLRRVRNTLRSISRSSFRGTSGVHDDEDSIRPQRIRGSGGGGGGALKMLQRVASPRTRASVSRADLRHVRC
eukprot:1600894-Rhodomonas_salina.1